MILRMLKANAPQLKSYGKGFSMPTEAETKAAEEAKLATEKAAAEAETKRLAELAKNKPVEKPSADGQGQGEADSGDAPAIPHGSKAMAAMHKGLSGLQQKCMKAAGSLEPDSAAKEHLDGLADALGGHVADLSEAHSKCYKDLPKLGESETKDMDGDDDSDEKSFAKFLADGVNSRLKLTGVMARMKSFADAKNLTAEQKSAIEAVTSRVSGLMTEAKSLAAGKTDKKSADSVTFSAAAIAKLTAVTKMFAELDQQIKDAVPAKK